MSSKLYVGNLPYETTETELEGLFAQTGAVASVNVVRDRETGRPRGFAFVEMASEADAKNAIAQLRTQRGDIVRVRDGDSNVRIWIDERSSRQ